jgi:hypothetical protein
MPCKISESGKRRNSAERVRTLYNGIGKLRTTHPELFEVLEIEDRLIEAESYLIRAVAAAERWAKEKPE